MLCCIINTVEVEVDYSLFVCTVHIVVVALNKYLLHLSSCSRIRIVFVCVCVCVCGNGSWVLYTQLVLIAHTSNITDEEKNSILSQNRLVWRVCVCVWVCAMFTHTASCLCLSIRIFVCVCKCEFNYQNVDNQFQITENQTGFCLPNKSNKGL